MKEIKLNEDAIKALTGGNKLQFNDEVIIYPPNYQEYHLTQEQFNCLERMIYAKAFNGLEHFLKTLKSKL